MTMSRIMHEKRCVGHDADVHGVETGRAGRDGLEQALQKRSGQAVLALCLDAEENEPAHPMRMSHRLVRMTSDALPARACPRAAISSCAASSPLKARKLHQHVETDAAQKNKQP